jgi:hypothetical protein
VSAPELCQKWDWTWNPARTRFCALPADHPGACERVDHDCPACGIEHGICAHCWAHRARNPSHAHTAGCKHFTGEAPRGHVTEEQLRELLLLARALWGERATAYGYDHAEGFESEGDRLRRHGGFVAFISDHPCIDGYETPRSMRAVVERWGDTPEGALVRLLGAVRFKADRRLRWNRTQRDELRAEDRAIRAALNPSGTRDDSEGP